MTAVVTGASGHLGVNLIRSLLADGIEVRALVHRNRAPLRGLDVEIVAGDVTDPGALVAAFEGAEVVYHLAGVIVLGRDRGGAMRRVNVDGAAAAAHAAHRAAVGRFVLCSSIHSFDLGCDGGTVDESSPRVPPHSARHAPYDRSKADGERRVREEIALGLDGVIVHPTSVIGPWDFEPSRMGRVFLGMFERTLPALVDGSFDFVDVRDVAAGMRLAAERGAVGESYLLSGHRASVGDVAALAAKITGARPPRITIPNRAAALCAPLIEAFAGMAGSEPIYTRASIGILRNPPTVSRSKATRDLGYSVRSLEETIGDVYAWFAAGGRIEWVPDE